nr:hypothetical protein orf158b [Schizostauron trachyderma]
MSKSNRIFVFVLIGILWICKPMPYEDVFRNRLARQEVLQNRGGGQDSTVTNSTGLKILLENLFPDWADRVAYQKQQEKFFQSGKKKLQEATRVRMSNSIKLTLQEQDALDYFHGAGFYKDHQDSNILPNIFDTRQSFLLKMENPKMRTTFLNNYSNRK